MAAKLFKAEETELNEPQNKDARNKPAAPLICFKFFATYNPTNSFGFVISLVDKGSHFSNAA